MSWLGGLVDNVKDFFGDLADNAEALFSGEKKVFGENVNKKKSSKKQSKKTSPVIKSNSGKYVATSSGKTYNNYYDYLKARSYAKQHSWDNFRKNWKKYNSGEISYEELYRYIPSYQKQQRIENQKEYDKKYAEEHASDRGILDKVLGMIGYNGVVEGLYNILDDDPNTTFSSGLKKGTRRSVGYSRPYAAVDLRRR